MAGGGVNEQREMHPVERVAFVVAFGGLVAGVIAWILTGWWGWGLIGFGVLLVGIIGGVASPPARDRSADREGPGSGVAP